MAKKEDSSLLRFGVSIEETLLKKFDSFISNNNYKNRSEALRDLIRIALVEEEWENADKEVAGVGDVPAVGPLTAGVLGGDQPAEPHERPGGRNCQDLWMGVSRDLLIAS